MANTGSRAPIQPGDRAPDFVLPAAHRKGTVAVADYRGRSPVRLALFRGLRSSACTLRGSASARTRSGRPIAPTESRTSPRRRSRGEPCTLRP
jgi:hypothetical protein